MNIASSPGIASLRVWVFQELGVGMPSVTAVARLNTLFDCLRWKGSGVPQLGEPLAH